MKYNVSKSAYKPSNPMYMSGMTIISSDITVISSSWHLHRRQKYNKASGKRVQVPAAPRVEEIPEQGKGQMLSVLPGALPGTPVSGSRGRSAPPRPRSGSAALHRNAHFRSSLWSLWSCALAHHCKLSSPHHRVVSQRLLRFTAAQSQLFPFPGAVTILPTWR